MHKTDHDHSAGHAPTAVESTAAESTALFDTPERAYAAYRSSPAGLFDRYHARHADETALISPARMPHESPYHYNLVENGIVDILRKHAPAVTGLDVLDIGCGTGHWVDFFSQVLEARSVVGADFSQTAAERLTARYSNRPEVSIRRMDISEPEPGFEGRFAVVSASGILFHIVDDPRWARAIGNIVDYLAPNGVAIVGGDFGDRTEEIGVMRKVRSLDAWDQALGRAGGRRVELIRFDWFKGGVNPGLKDNLLAIQRRGDGGDR